MSISRCFTSIKIFRVAMNDSVWKERKMRRTKFTISRMLFIIAHYIFILLSVQCVYIYIH